MSARRVWVQRTHNGEVVIELNGEMVGVGTAQPTEYLSPTMARSLARHLLAAADNSVALSNRVKKEETR